VLPEEESTQKKKKKQREKDGISKTLPSEIVWTALEEEEKIPRAASRPHSSSKFKSRISRQNQNGPQMRGFEGQYQCHSRRKKGHIDANPLEQACKKAENYSGRDRSRATKKNESRLRLGEGVNAGQDKKHLESRKKEKNKGPMHLDPPKGKGPKWVYVQGDERGEV